jgi:hypothetical protein
MTVLLCESIVESTCAVGDHVFFHVAWFYIFLIKVVCVLKIFVDP